MGNFKKVLNLAKFLLVEVMGLALEEPIEILECENLQEIADSSIADMEQNLMLLYDEEEDKIEIRTQEGVLISKLSFKDKKLNRKFENLKTKQDYIDEGGNTLRQYISVINGKKSILTMEEEEENGVHKLKKITEVDSKFDKSLTTLNVKQFLELFQILEKAKELNLEYDEESKKFRIVTDDKVITGSKEEIVEEYLRYSGMTEESIVEVLHKKIETDKVEGIDESKLAIDESNFLENPHLTNFEVLRQYLTDTKDELEKLKLELMYVKKVRKEYKLFEENPMLKDSSFELGQVDGTYLTELKEITDVEVLRKMLLEKWELFAKSNELNFDILKDNRVDRIHSIDSVEKLQYLCVQMDILNSSSREALFENITNLYTSEAITREEFLVIAESRIRFLTDNMRMMLKNTGVLLDSGAEEVDKREKQLYELEALTETESIKNEKLKRAEGIKASEREFYDLYEETEEVNKELKSLESELQQEEKMNGLIKIITQEKIMIRMKNASKHIGIIPNEKIKSYILRELNNLTQQEIKELEANISYEDFENENIYKLYNEAREMHKMQSNIARSYSKEEFNTYYKSLTIEERIIFENSFLSNPNIRKASSFMRECAIEVQSEELSNIVEAFEEEHNNDRKSAFERLYCLLESDSRIMRIATEEIISNSGSEKIKRAFEQIKENSSNLSITELCEIYDERERKIDSNRAIEVLRNFSQLCNKDRIEGIMYLHTAMNTSPFLEDAIKCAYISDSPETNDLFTIAERLFELNKDNAGDLDLEGAINDFVTTCKERDKEKIYACIKNVEEEPYEIFNMLINASESEKGTLAEMRSMDERVDGIIEVYSEAISDIDPSNISEKEIAELLAACYQEMNERGLTNDAPTVENIG